uniref:FAM20 C-terminal domain-containing protein n=1 Tax=Strigamia maritima TaxID=126957 RepID=T1JFA5_STRMM
FIGSKHLNSAMDRHVAIGVARMMAVVRMHKHFGAYRNMIKKQGSPYTVKGLKNLRLNKNLKNLPFVLFYLFTELLENEKFKFLLSYRKPESVVKFVSVLVSQMTFANGSKVNWNVTNSWLNSRQIHPNNAEYFGDVLQRMANEKIVKANVGGVGTQIKMMLMLEGGQKVLFKPMVEKREFIADSSPYAGKDRHNCEIASFHLNRLFNFRRCPLVIGRRINLAEIYKVADERLKKTFFKKGNKLCFYGVCHYCRRSNAICADQSNVLEGALILWIPQKLKTYKHPWSRTYKKNVLARWEKENDYCAEVKQLSLYRTGPRLLDLIDATIFDFISGNADRHHYEVLNGYNDGVVLLLDNGKSFGNPFKDEIKFGSRPGKPLTNL